jgi:hypothetical protein
LAAVDGISDGMIYSATSSQCHGRSGLELILESQVTRTLCLLTSGTCGSGTWDEIAKGYDPLFPVAYGGLKLTSRKAELIANKMISRER